MNHAVCLLSGGLDSAVLLWHAIQAKWDPIALSINYDQRHKRELLYARQLTSVAGVEHIVLELPQLREVLSKSALTSDEIAVPNGHYAAENMKITVVPNRNMILLSIAGGLAVSRGCRYVVFAAHSGDHMIYPDCTPEFIAAAQRAMLLGTAGEDEVLLNAPFEPFSKADIVRYGAELHVPFQLTWSCYNGGYKHCGKCGTCTERREAFVLAGVTDPTEYEA